MGRGGGGQQVKGKQVQVSVVHVGDAGHLNREV